MNGPSLSFRHLPVIPLRGTEGGQIGSSPPRTPPGERGRTIWMANLQFPAVG